MRSRILWLAVAEARGHLVRAHLARSVLGARGLEVEIVTTSDAGREFLRALGTESRVLSREHRMVFDERQNLARAETESAVLRYLFGGCRRDLAALAELARGADLVVNDSFHPALVVAPLVGAPLPPVVQVYGPNLLATVEGHFEGRAPRAVARAWRSAVRGSFEASFALVEHGFGRPRVPSAVVLPPLISMPRRTVARAPGEKLAVVYLNPYFRDARAAGTIERGLAGFRVHAVGEGFAGRAGWLATDPDLASWIAAADVMVSAPGMATIAQARAFGTPLVALLTDQPEQARNLAFLDGHAWAGVALDDVESLAGAARALSERPPPRPSSICSRANGAAATRGREIQTMWADHFLDLAARSRERARARDVIPFVLAASGGGA